MDTKLPFELINTMDQKRAVEEDIAVVQRMLKNIKPNVLLLEARGEARMILDTTRYSHINEAEELMTRDAVFV